ncbi:hypothetical protein ACO0QE_004395 [Hanseniaspora vineae]
MSVQQQETKEARKNETRESQGKSEVEVKPEQSTEESHKKRSHEEDKPDTENDKDSEKKELDETTVNKKPRLEKITDNVEAETYDTSKQPKIAFGASSPFSGGFGSVTSGLKPFGSFGSFGTVKSPSALTQNLTSESKSEGGSTASSSKAEVKTFPSFGSSMSFGAGFGVLKKTEDASTESKDKEEEGAEVESNKEDKVEKEDKTQEKIKDKSEGQKEDDKEDSKNQTKEVSIKPSETQLTAQEVKSGEEDDVIKFQSNAKLYELIDIKEGWKERGVGPLHVNENKESGKSRIIMRNKALLNVILNLPLVKGFKVYKGFPGSVQGDKFIRIVAVNESQKPVQYAIKVGKVESIDELVECIDVALQK